MRDIQKEGKHKEEEKKQSLSFTQVIFAEGGEWDPETPKYRRKVDKHLGEGTYATKTNPILGGGERNGWGKWEERKWKRNANQVVRSSKAAARMNVTFCEKQKLARVGASGGAREMEDQTAGIQWIKYKVWYKR